VIGLDPARGLFDDLLDHVVLDNFADVDLVMSLLENAVLTGVLHLHIIEQLEPQVFQLVGVVLEEIEVVSDGGENLIEFRLKVTAVVLRCQLGDLLRLRFACLRVGSAGSIGGVSLRGLLGNWDLIDEAVLLRVLIELVFDGPNDAFNLLLEESCESVSIELFVAILLLDTLLLIDN
jgi:hypothetical protein